MCVLKAKDQGNRLEELCAVLKKEAVAPAQEEAKNLLDKAKEEAKRLIEMAKMDAESILKAAREEAKTMQDDCDQQLRFAARQLEEKLKGFLEESLFHPELIHVLEKGFSKKGGEVLLRAIATSIDQMGLDRAVFLELPKGFEFDSVLQDLLQGVIGRSKSRKLQFEGESLRCHFQNEGWRLELSSEALAGLFWPIIRKDLREKLFLSHER